MGTAGTFFLDIMLTINQKSQNTESTFCYVNVTERNVGSGPAKFYRSPPLYTAGYEEWGAVVGHTQYNT